MSSSLIPLAHPEIVRLRANARQWWNVNFTHLCGADDLLTVEEVRQSGDSYVYNIRMIGRTDSLWLAAEDVIGMRWLGGMNWEPI